MKKIITTLGPSTKDENVLKRLNDCNIEYVRINLSHTPLEKIKSELEFYSKELNFPIVIDTEGSQVRTGDLKSKNIVVNNASKVRVYANEITCSSKEIYLRPPEAVLQLDVGDLIFIDFDSALLKVDDVTTLKSDGYVTCTALNSGVIGNNKAVTIPNQKEALPPLSTKDIYAIKVAKDFGVNHVNLSFADKKEDIQAVKDLNNNAYVISKVETKLGLINLKEIVAVSDAILIDRGDLSREVAIEKIAFAQKEIIKVSKENNTPVFVATNFLDTMMTSRKPSRAEVNDIMNTLIDGADGLVLAAETAVGNHPVESVNFLESMFIEFEKQKNNKISFNNIHSGNYLVEPNGKNLTQSIGGVDLAIIADSLNSLNVNEEIAMDAESIALGVYSPIESFLDSENFWSVLESYKLNNGTVWSMPICLQRHSTKTEENNEIEVGMRLILKENGESVAQVEVSEIYTPDLEKASKLFFGTSDESHPGVSKFKNNGKYFIAGKVTLIKRRSNPFKKYEITPSQSRMVFENRGWKKIVAFHSRNPIHRSHEFIQMQAIKRINADGLFAHPVIGKKKTGDFTASSIIRSYEIMLQEFYDHSKVFFGVFPTYSRYAGPREALFTALCRQNYGCSHFIIGRDHTGVGNFYSKNASQEIFEKFPNIGIKAVCFDNAVYLPKQRKYAFEGECNNIEHKKLSGTRIRDLIKEGKHPESWLMRPEISSTLINRMKSGENLFVGEQEKESNQGHVVWFSGLSGSGKSTLANAIKEKLTIDGKSVCIIDGDTVRDARKKKLGFSREDILENNKEIISMAKSKVKDFDYVLIPVIAPLSEIRELARKELGDAFKLIFVDASVAECEKRDVKGLYAKARAGLINNLVGFSSANPYEKPLDADLTVNTEKEEIEVSVDRVFSFIS